MYYTQLWLDWLPVVQKIVFVLKMALILSLTWGPTEFPVAEVSGKQLPFSGILTIRQASG